MLPYKDTSKLRITNPYGVVNSMYTAGYHSGVDLVSDGGKTIVAIRGGKVIRSQKYGDWGNYIVVEQDDKYYCVYAHLSQRYVEIGTAVAPGQEIGLEGKTGNATGSHLHIELEKEYYVPKSSINAATYLGIVNEIGPLKFSIEFIKELKIIKEGQDFWGCLIKRGDQYKALVELRPFAESNGQEVIANIEQGEVIVNPSAL